MRLGFQLKARPAARAIEVDCRHISRRSMQLSAIAIRTVQIPMGPNFGRYPRALGIALVAFETLLRERDLHLRIRSLSLG